MKTRDSLEPRFQLAPWFSETTREAWRERLEKDLKGRPFEKLVAYTEDGIPVEPLYSSDPDAPRLPDAVRADLSERKTRVAARVIDPADFDSRRADAAFVGPVHERELDALIEAIGLQHALHLQPTAGAVESAAIVFASAERDGVDLRALQGCLAVDPLAVLAQKGRLPIDADRVDRLLAETASVARRRLGPDMRAFSADARHYRASGATAAQEVAFAIATLVDYARRVETILGDGSTVLSGTELRLSLDTRPFESIAALRATRWLVQRIANVCDAPDAARRLRIVAEPSMATISAIDPAVNLLRNSVASFAAQLGGADLFVPVAWDQRRRGGPESLGRRIALNTPLILDRESHLTSVADPAGGSYFIESLTVAMAHEAWKLFTQIEDRGGMLHALSSGYVQGLVTASAASRREAVATRKRPITGVSEFPNPTEALLQVAPSPSEPIEATLQASGAAAAALDIVRLALANDDAETPQRSRVFAAALRAVTEGATSSQLRLAVSRGRLDAPQLVAQPHGHDLETLRFRASETLPTVFLVKLGALAQHNPRAQFVRNFLATGGVVPDETEHGLVDADAIRAAVDQAQATTVCVCGSEADYTRWGEDAIAAARAGGATLVLVAGKARETLSADHFVHLGSDLLATHARLSGETRGEEA